MQQILSCVGFVCSSCGASVSLLRPISLGLLIVPNMDMEFSSQVYCVGVSKPRQMSDNYLYNCTVVMDFRASSCSTS
jgi:hypothetical protein